MNEQIFDIFGLPISSGTFNSLVSLELSMALGILGIAITIFTVIYSFLGSKVQQRKMAQRSVHIGEKADPYLQAELKFMRLYIKRNKAVNSAIIKIIFTSMLMALLLFINILIVDKYLFFITQFASIVYALCFVVLIIRYIRSYFKEVR